MKTAIALMFLLLLIGCEGEEPYFRVAVYANAVGDTSYRVEERPIYQWHGRLVRAGLWRPARGTFNSLAEAEAYAVKANAEMVRMRERIEEEDRRAEAKIFRRIK